VCRQTNNIRGFSGWCVKEKTKIHLWGLKGKCVYSLILKDLYNKKLACYGSGRPDWIKSILYFNQCLGLPPLYLHPTIPLSAHYALNIFYHAHKSAPFIHCPQRSRRPVLIAFRRTLILLLLCSSGDVEVNPGPACPQAPSFVDFCDRKGLGFMHVNIRSLLPKFVLLTAVSESWLRKATKNSEISIPNYNTFRQDRTAKGGGVAIYCTKVLSYFPGLCPNSSNF
jgi:hypothetical protein